jgi:hypothetical protein
MVRRCVAALLFLGAGGCWSTEPDYVVKQRPVLCDPRSQLVRRGYPENLDALFTGNCTVTRTEGMRGPDFTSWLAGGSSAITSCETQFPVPFWTEKSPEGKITKVHFCPEFCMELRAKLEEEIRMDNELVCEKDAGVAGSGVTTADTGVLAPRLDGGSAFGFPLAGSSAAAGSGGTAGFAAAGTSSAAARSGGTAGFAAAGTSSAAAGSGGTAGFAAAGTSSTAAGAGGSAGMAGTSGAGTSGASGAAGLAGAGGI